MKQDWHPEELALHWTFPRANLNFSVKDRRRSAQFRHSSKGLAIGWALPAGERLKSPPGCGAQRNSRLCPADPMVGEPLRRIMLV